jgi:hypothetical protein
MSVIIPGGVETKAGPLKIENNYGRSTKED